MAASPQSGSSPVRDSVSALSTSASTATTALNLDNKDLEDLVAALDSVDLSISEFTDGLLDFYNEKDQKAAHPPVVKARSPLGLTDGTGDDEDTEEDDDSDEDDTEDDEEEDSEEYDDEEEEEEGDEPEPEIAELTAKSDAAPVTEEKVDTAKAGRSSMMDLFSGWENSSTPASTETSPPQPQNEDVPKSVVNPAIAKLRAASPTGLPPSGNKRSSVARKRISKFVGLGELSFEKSDFDFSSLQFTAKTYKLGKTAAEKEVEREEEKARKRAEKQRKKEEAAAGVAAAEAAAKATELDDRAVYAVRSDRARKVESILLQNSSQSPIAGLMSAVAGGDQAKINELKRILEAKQTQMRASLLPPPRSQPEFGSEGGGAPNRGMEEPVGMYWQASGPGYGAPPGNAPPPGAGSPYGYAEQQQQYGHAQQQQPQQQFVGGANYHQTGYDSARMANPQQQFVSPSRGPPPSSTTQTPPGAADLPSINTNWTPPPRTKAAPGAPPIPVGSVPPTPPRTPQILPPGQDASMSDDVPSRRTGRPQVSITLPTREDSAASTPSPAGHGSNNAVSPTRNPPVSPNSGSSGATSPNPHVPPRGTSATHSARMRDSAIHSRGSSQPARNSPVIQSVSPPPQPPTPSKGEAYQSGRSHGHTPPPGALPPQIQHNYSQGQYSSPKPQPLPYQSAGQGQYQSPQTPYQQSNQSTPQYQQSSQYQSPYQTPPSPSKPPIQQPFGSPAGAPSPQQQQQSNGTGVQLVSSSSHIKTIPLSALHKSGQAAIQVAVPQDALQFQPTTTTASEGGGGGGGVRGLELLRGDFGVSDSVVMGVYNPSAVKAQVSSSPYQGGVYQGGRGPQAPGLQNVQGPQGQQQQQQQGGVMGRLWGGR
ncbi:hypothetical protein BJ742DRAFT_807908 [Cladochytrium replicatum]|nr:hypothetical protein BJ742DRAFT_807908 [Cladochytrium replicatum]